MAPSCKSSPEAAEVERGLRASVRERAVKVFEFNPVEDPRWEAFRQLHPDASIFHRTGWLRALRDCYGYEPRVLTLTPPELPLTTGLVFCHVRSFLTGDRLVSLPFSDHCEPLVSSPEQFELLLTYLTETVDRSRWKYFEVRPVSSAPHVRNGFGASNTYFLQRIDLRPSEESLFRGFHKDSIQRTIRRAEREQLRYEAGTSEELLNSFYKLLVLTRRRLGLPPQPRKWFQSLIAGMGQSLKIRVAFKDELPIASILTLSDKKTVVYKYGCSDVRFNKLGGTALLLWRTIQEAKTDGFESFDLGRSDVGNQGLATFKERWGATCSTVHYWRYPAAAASPTPEFAIKHFKRLIPFAPKRTLVMLGNLLYRHIG